MGRLRLMTWNLREGGRGSDGQRLDLVATVLRAARPDVFVACEAHGFLEDARLLADFSAAVGLKGRIAPSDAGDHVALFTKPSIPVPHFEALALGGPRRAALAVLRLGFCDVLLAGVHLDHESPGSRLRQAEALLARMPAEWPRIVMGDLNQISHLDGLTRADMLLLPLHHVERHVAPDGEPDTRVTRLLETAGLVDAWRLAHAGAPPRAGHTVPTDMPQPPRFGGKRIDYVLLSADVPAALTACDVWRDKPAPRASDHFPVVADLEPHGG